MTDWRHYWNNASIVLEKDFLRQVGKTINGQPIPVAQLDLMIGDIVDKLQLSPSDRVLDLCCGNGLLTHRCAQHCMEITGLDFSAPLVRVASTHFKAENITYVECDICALPQELTRQPFTKLYMYEALQHITDSELETVLRALRTSELRSAPLFIGSIPDKERIWNFYNTPERRAEYQRRLESGTEAIGHWWTKAEVASSAKSCGYTTSFSTPHPSLDSARYRFDVLLVARV